MTATRYDTQVVVTEQGVAWLRDATVSQKAERLIAVAHPDFRAELTEALGVEWRPGNTVPEIAGVPQQLLDQFSKRSTDIDAWLEAHPDT